MPETKESITTVNAPIGCALSSFLASPVAGDPERREGGGSEREVDDEAGQVCAGRSTP